MEKKKTKKGFWLIMTAPRTRLEIRPAGKSKVVYKHDKGQPYEPFQAASQSLYDLALRSGCCRIPTAEELKKIKGGEE